MVSNQRSHFSKPIHYGWAVFAVTALFYSYEFIQRLSPTAMIPELIHDLHISAAAMGQLSAWYYYAYASFQIPAGILTDRGNIRYLLTGSALLVALGSILEGSTTSIQCMYLARALIGLGSAFAFISCLKLSTSWFPAKHMPFLVGLINLGGVFGAIAGGAPLSWLIDTIGWRESLLWGGILGLVIALLIFTVVRRGPLQPDVIASKAPRGYFEGFSQVLLSKQSWLIACYGALIVGPLAAFSELWSVPFLMKAYHLSGAMATFSNSLVFFGIALGGPSIGWLAMQQRFSLAKVMRLCTIGALLCFITILFCTAIPHWLLFILLISYGALTSHMLLCFSFASLAHPHWLNGLAVGFTNTMIMMGGSLLQPCVGYMLDYRLDKIMGGQIDALGTLDYQMVLCILPLFLLTALGLIRYIEIPASLNR